MQFCKALSDDAIKRSANRFILRQVQLGKWYVKDNHILVEINYWNDCDFRFLGFVPDPVTPDSIDAFIEHLNRVLQGSI